MALWILRCVFLISMAGVGFVLVEGDKFHDRVPYPLTIFILLMVGSVGLVGLDAAFPRKRIDMVSCIYFGIFVGLCLSVAIGFAIEPMFNRAELESEIVTPIRVLISVVLCYACVSVLLQTKDDFRFVIPYVEFSKEVKGAKPYVLDTSVVIDGRIADVVETGVFDNQLIMPRFVLAELQGIADSGDKLRRARGRRGLDILNRLRNADDVELQIYDREYPEMNGEPVDMKLVLLAKRLEGKIVTGDYNLNKIARLQSVEVINLNDIGNALKPVFLPGEQVEVKIVKPDEEAGQGVGYLDDGTMIVVEDGRDFLNQVVMIIVTSVLQTSAGRMIFGRRDDGGSKR